MGRYFLGVGLPLREREVLGDLKRRLHPKKRLTSPPHVTLVPPFGWQNEQALLEKLGKLVVGLVKFEARFAKVGSFHQRKYGTVFLVPERGRGFRKLASLLYQKVLRENLGEYVPHLTVAQKVKIEDLQKIKRRVREMGIELRLQVDRLVLYKFEGRRWQRYCEFLFTD